ncbi:MAG TPA: penicillin-binding protein activator [bacterium]|nr:penicillin-binding protein activator [bacterium]
MTESIFKRRRARHLLVSLLALTGVFLYLILCTSSLQGGQIFSRHPARKEFSGGVKQYNNQNYQLALQTFRELYNYPEFNPVATATHLMLMKTYQRLQLYRQSVQFGKEFLSTYPSSSYLDDVYFTMAESFVGMEQYMNGASYYAYAITQAEDEALARMSLEQLLKVTDAFLNTEQVQALADGAIGRDESNIFQLALLQEYILDGEMSLATTTAMELERSVMKDMLIPTFQALRKAISLDAKKQMSIAVLAPLSGAYADIGRELLDGVRYALAQANDLANINLLPMDNQGTGLETVHQMQRMADHYRVVAVIGPVYSENVVAAATTAGISSLPLITPTATENGLAGLNAYVFQLSPDYETRGRAAAQYATDSLGLRLFATVSPADEQGKALTDAFTAEVEKRGGDIVDQLWYSDTPEDLNDQWRHLREVGFDLRTQFEGGIDTSHIVSDSLRETLSDSDFVEVFQKNYENYTEEIDSTDITLKYIEGMYFPIRNRDIDYIAGQFAFYNFDTQVLGNVEWYDLEKLNEYSSYINNMFIFSDYYIPEEAITYRGFVSDFRQEMNTTPSNLHLYGYDTMNLLLDLIRDGNMTRASIGRALGSIHQVSGIARVHTLDGISPRVNQSVRVLQYSRQRVRLEDTITTGVRKIHPLRSLLSE